MPVDVGLLERISTQLAEPSKAAKEAGESKSFLAAAADSYAARPTDEDEVTQPTGFDPEAAALFEAVVESAFLVATSDGVFDETERATFSQIVHVACGRAVSEQGIQALLLDLEDQVKEDGVDRRVDMIGRTIRRPAQAYEALRVAALLAILARSLGSCTWTPRKSISLNSETSIATAPSSRIV